MAKVKVFVRAPTQMPMPYVQHLGYDISSPDIITLNLGQWIYVMVGYDSKKYKMIIYSLYLALLKQY